MNTELDTQNKALTDLEKGVDKALDDVDNINIKLKKTLDNVKKSVREVVELSIFFKPHLFSH
jgi:hypothetical protein